MDQFSMNRQNHTGPVFWIFMKLANESFVNPDTYCLVISYIFPHYNLQRQII
jgi:hypothetical protein